MTDIASTVPPLLVLACAFLAGHSLPPFFRRKPDAPAEPQPVCGCRHHYCMHNPETGKCNVTVAIATYDANGKRHGQTAAICPCVHYTGPEPLPAIYAPPPAA